MQTPIKPWMRGMLWYLVAIEAWRVASGWLPEVRTYRRKQELLYRPFLKPGDLCFDIGAHVGERTRTFIRLGARVVAVEPQPNCLRRLNFGLGRHRGVAIVPSAVGASPGVGSLAICDEAPTISSMSQKFREAGRFSGDYQWTRTVEVPVTTLDALIATYGIPAFCKIDVEGYELQVLMGLSRAIPALSFEFGWDTLQETRACLERLGMLGPLKVNFSLEESMEWGLPEWTDSEGLLTRLEAIIARERRGGDVYVRLDA